MPTEKPIVKKIPAKKQKALTVQSLKDEARRMAGDAKAALINFLGMWEKSKDIVKNNFQLGKYHLGLGNFSDAILRFKFVLWLEPLHADAWYYLGATYMAKGDKKAAAAAFRKALDLKPGNEDAIYLLTVATGQISAKDGSPRRMPLTLAREYFDSLAATYTEDQVRAKYEGHIEVCNSLRSFMPPGRVDHVVLDLGVGTGLCGPLLRDVSAHITGVDFSAAMLNEAMKLQDKNGEKIYKALIKSEVHEFLQDSPEESYDVVLSTNLFSYLGELDRLFPLMVRVLKRNGYVAFSADVMEGEGYSFDPVEARFHHSKAYLQGLAQASGLKELKFKEAVVYPETSAWICVFQKA